MSQPVPVASCGGTHDPWGHMAGQGGERGELDLVGMRDWNLSSQAFPEESLWIGLSGTGYGENDLRLLIIF